MSALKIYVASSWKNDKQPEVVKICKELGYEVYDFKEDNGFHWSDIDPLYKDWTPEDYTMKLLTESYCKEGFNADMQALIDSDICILVLPCNLSAHLELGWALGAGKHGIICLDENFEPELMYMMACVITSNIQKDNIEIALKAIEEKCLKGL